MRTALALVAAAAAVDALPLNFSDSVQSALATTLAVAALLTSLSAWRSWARAERAMREGAPLPSNPAILVVIAAVAASAFIIGVGSLLGV